ncbi:ABC transporter permease [Candidatus Bathyarchaeota archaeon]|nr:ABC transporter permease [Candidatus Bathyarchaeota archaeon]
MWQDNLRGIYYIALKDMRTYYLKPPSISWGIVFPVVWILAFYLRSPRAFEDLVPGLIAMTILFSTTAAEAVVINFELRIGSLERLLLAPLTFSAVLLGKVLGGAVFGLLMTTLVTIVSVVGLGLHVNVAQLALIIIPSLFAFSAMGALLCVMVREVFEAQTLANLPRFLMMFLSGVSYPISAMPQLLQYVAYLLPLTYTVDGLRHALSSSDTVLVLIDSLILIAVAVIFTAPAIKLLRRKFI